MYKALTIAGSDSGGGAGIQADLKTFTAFGVYGMSALTAITAQNTIGVQGIYEITPEFVYEQIKSIMSDIGTDAVKTGMLANPAIVKKVAQAVEEFHIPILVVDPVMIAKSGDPLLSEDARKTVKELLIPLATVITPNLYEAEVMLAKKIESLDDMKGAAAVNGWLSKVAIYLSTKMPMMWFIMERNIIFLNPNALKQKIPMARDVHFLLLLRQVWPKDTTLCRPSGRPRSILRMR
jgi:hydroxymethylpyrimidine kinase/phosphomethylpyrimidine kinase